MPFATKSSTNMARFFETSKQDIFNRPIVGPRRRCLFCRCSFRDEECEFAGVSIENAAVPSIHCVFDGHLGSAATGSERQLDT